MDIAHGFQRQSLISILLSLALFWLVLFLPVPDAFKQYFHRYNLGLFLIVLVLYYFSFRLRDRFQTTACLGLTMILTALCLSYTWSSGFSDNFIIGGLVPYKDAKNYYFGSQLLLNGSAMLNAGQATERPLFPSFLAGILWLTGQNLKITLGIATQLIAVGIFLSSKQVQKSFGAIASSLFATLLYFYIQPMLGYTMSETLGFIAGCCGFALIWSAARDKKRAGLVIGTIMLLIAVSARAGAFFIFPVLALWMGWIFRGEKKFSFQLAGYALIGIILGYFLINSAYSRLIKIPAGSSFANFSYALYGQVRGGTGWHSAIEDLGTRDPSVVYAEAWKFFQQHPTSLLLGFTKSYRDFFLASDGSIFPFGTFGIQNWPNSLMRIAALVLVIMGLVKSIKLMDDSHPSLALAGWIGIFLSIPFLPPIDGGSRFYAGTVPFFFVLPAFGASSFNNTKMIDSSLEDGRIETASSRYTSIALMLITFVLAPLIFSLARRNAVSASSCPEDQEPFYIEYHAGSFVDLVQRESASCGFLPEICLDDFENNNVEKSVDDFYQTILQYLHEGQTNVRLIPAVNALDSKFHYFYVAPGNFDGNLEAGTMSGCAVEVLTKNQSIYKVESWFPVP